MSKGLWVSIGHSEGHGFAGFFLQWWRTWWTYLFMGKGLFTFHYHIVDVCICRLFRPKS